MDTVEPGCSGVKIVTRQYVFQKTKGYEEKDFGKKLDLVEQELISDASFPIDQKNKFIHTFSHLKAEMKSKWQTAKRTETVFLKKYQKWLQGTLEIPKNVTNKHLVGRPHKVFEDLAECSKRRKTTHLRSENEAESLIYAGQMALREKGNVDAAHVVKDVMSSPTRGYKYRQAFRKSHTPEKRNTQLTPTEALSMFVEASLTRKQYEIIRESSKKLYPCYSILKKEKQACYPDVGAYRVTETCAEITLQALLDHTAQRLILYLEEVLKKLTTEEMANLELTYKWGCDGSQQAQYKQKFANNTDSDANIFQSSLVPLRLICKCNNKIIWNNPTPSSPCYCRPMRIRFIHESKDVINEEISYHNEQIKHLTASRIKLQTCEVKVYHKLLFTMVDGKVCNAATNTLSTMRCYICKATSKQFNDLEIMEKTATDPENVKFGLSILHARIRFFETLLHISYKNTIKKWQVRSQAEKDIVKERKAQIQDGFKTELGLIVDVPTVNYGNSNDGNTSRRFFNNAETSANITGIDKTLIDRFATIWR
ncbi:uncharacterized protein [Choristoneura fumiferana]|uniref:uncharacterized protein n=1 Tax=Choristoneura fumiferana TaxID=7141 RepID=UPI003D155DCA